jgi:NAD+ diphosphatase
MHPIHFVPAVQPPASSERALWFLFRRRALLLTDDFALPEPPPLAPVRRQFLGYLGDRPCFCAELAADAEAPPGFHFCELRGLFGRLPEPYMALAGRAVQIVEWDRTHQFCGACGAPTQGHATQRARVCEACRLEFYPRVAPAMIVAVERGPEILLARSPHFPPEIFSVLAGFVEPGESAEEAVHREVFEETAIRVRNVRYFGSQPWPFPHSLMLGFQAEYAGGEVVPQAGEIEAAGFFHVDALPMTFSGRVSISQWLLQDFLRRHGRGL